VYEQRFVKKRTDSQNTSECAETTAALIQRLRALQRARRTEAAASAEEGLSAVEDAAPRASEDCAICLGAFDISDAATLDGCTHRFCRDCIVAWSAITSRCPLCKRAFAAITHAGAQLAVEAREQRIDGAAHGFPVLDDADDEDEEESPCDVCGSAAEEHLLLLCDGEGCDGACHVGCAGLEAVPEGEWFCWRCETARRRAVQRAKAGVAQPEQRRRRANAERTSLPPPSPCADAGDEGTARSPSRDGASTAVTHTAAAAAAAAAPAASTAAPTLFERFRFGQG
jgi:hypothetical protein